MAHFDVELHHIAAEVEIPVLQPHLFVGENGFSRQERRLLRFIEQTQLLDHQLNFAGGNVLVHRLAITLLHRADDSNHVFITQCLSFIVRGGIQLAIDYNLRHPRTIAQVNKDDAAEVAPPVDPSHEDGLFTGIR